MKLSEEQVQDILAEVRPSIIEGLKVDLKQTIESQITYQAREEIGAYAKTWIADNVIPEVEKELVEAKSGLITLGVTMAEAMVTTLAEGLAKDMEERLNDKWKRGKMLKEMFGV